MPMYEEKEALNSSFGYTLNTKNTVVGESIYGEFLRGEVYFNKKFNNDATAMIFKCTQDFESETGNATIKEGSMFNIPGVVLAELFNKSLLVPGNHYRIERKETPNGKAYANWTVIALAIVGNEEKADDTVW